MEMYKQNMGVKMNEAENIGRLVKKFDGEVGYRTYEDFVNLYYRKHANELMDVKNSQSDWYKKRSEVFDRYVNKILRR